MAKRAKDCSSIVDPFLSTCQWSVRISPGGPWRVAMGNGISKKVQQPEIPRHRPVLDHNAIR